MTDLFASNQTRMQPRPYQAEAVEAIWQALLTRDDNPCAVLPTGAGKSPVMAWLIQRACEAYPPTRAIVLAHVAELVAQNADKMRAIWPGAPVGIYSAQLGSRQMQQPITFASIDSVYKKALDFDPFDLVIIDEAHRIPLRGDGKYRTFLREAKLANPNLRVIGVTATPYQMGVGSICHKDHILNHVAYEASVRDLIEQGYLCRLRSKAGDTQPDLSRVGKRMGEYVTSELSEAVDKQGVVSAAVAEAMQMAAGRQSMIFFCIDVAHCNHVSQELRKHGVHAPVVTGETPKRERERYASQFAQGQLRALCNVQVFTEGFDAPCCDAVVMLRPTQSKGLYYQMVGRGLRLHDAKQDCLVLDFAGNIDRHGPIDRLGAGGVELIRCKQCCEVFSRAVRVCPDCGWKIPPQEIERAAAESERTRQLHDDKASARSILAEPETLEVNGVEVNRHRKPGAPDSLRVTYRCGISQYREWVCLDHDGYAKTKAARWWFERFREAAPSVDEALQDMFLPAKLADVTETITVVHAGKYPEIKQIKLRVSATAGAQ